MSKNRTNRGSAGGTGGGPSPTATAHAEGAAPFIEPPAAFAGIGACCVEVAPPESGGCVVLEDGCCVGMPTAPAEAVSTPDAVPAAVNIAALIDSLRKSGTGQSKLDTILRVAGEAESVPAESLIAACAAAGVPTGTTDKIAHFARGST